MTWLIVAVAFLAGFLAWRMAIAAMVPKPGDAAPEFTLPDQGSAARSLADFHDKWLVLYFYPRDDTPGCTVQACAFRDAWQMLTALGAEVVGVSVDNVARHFAFAKKFELPFPLLVDAGGVVASRYGSALNLGVFKIARRNTFLIDPQGRIARVYVSANASRNSQQVIEDLQQLKKS